MKDFTQRGVCRAKKGLLVLHDCEAPATASCHKCGRPVCANHQVAAPQGPECSECAAAARPDADPRSELGAVPSALAGSLTRRRYYGGFHYLPYYHGHTHYYSDHDYRTFDEARSQDAVAVAAAHDLEHSEQGLDEGAPGQAEDFMES